MRAPLSLKKYFWDIRFENLDVRKRAPYVVERILEHGDETAARWMLGTYPRKTLVNVLRTSRALSAKCANFWSLFFGVRRETVTCLRKSFREKQKRFWPY